METIKETQFDQYIQYKALDFKFSGTSFPDSFMDAVLEDPDNKVPIKNVCAKLHVELSNKLDDTVNKLDMSKRKFIELALIQAIGRAEQIMDEVDMTELLREQNERKESEK